MNEQSDARDTHLPASVAPLTHEEMIRVEGGSLLDQAVAVVKAAYDIIKYAGQVIA